MTSAGDAIKKYYRRLKKVELTHRKKKKPQKKSSKKPSRFHREVQNLLSKVKRKETSLKKKLSK